MEQEVGVSRYVLRFSIIFLLLLIGLSILLGLIGAKSNTGVTIGALIGSALLAATKFLQDHKRLPTTSEKSRLVWLSFLASWIVSLIPFGLVVVFTSEGAQLMEAVGSASVLLVIGIAAFVSIFYLGTLSFAYGYMARKQFETLQKKGKI